MQKFIKLPGIELFEKRSFHTDKPGVSYDIARRFETKVDRATVCWLEQVGPFTRIHLDHGKELEVELSIYEVYDRLDGKAAS